MQLVATIDPTTHSHPEIMEMIGLGVTCYRLNLARGSPAACRRWIDSFRSTRASVKRRLTLFLDLPGPKSRLGDFIDGAVWLEVGDRFDLDLNVDIPGDARRAPLLDPKIIECATPGDKLILSSGRPILRVIQRASHRLRCAVDVAGKAYLYMGVAIHNRYRTNTCLTQRDIRLAQEYCSDADYLCPSFVDDKAIVIILRSYLGNRCKPRIIAKIESPVGIRNIASISTASDGLMVGRGDLSSFYTPFEIQQITLRIAKAATASSRPLSLATDYFKSMVHGAPFGEQDREELYDAIRLRPAYLVVNETSHSPYWREILAVGVDMIRD